jgi:thermitase
LSQTSTNPVPGYDKDKQWGLVRCGFPEIWEGLDVRDDNLRIGLIDTGRHRRHPELKDRIEYVPPTDPTQESIADHASSVAAIICALRGEGGSGGLDMGGGCSAKVRLYNVWTRNDGLDLDAFHNAFENAIELGLPVVNVSVWTDEFNETTLDWINKCERAGIVVVAPMGNLGSDKPLYPAAYPTVVGVAATDVNDQRHVLSNIGDVFIAAPGENIWTVLGDSGYDYFSGTSFAAAFVTAAVWLIRRNRRDLTPAQVREILSQLVATPCDTPSPELGFGRLDVRKLREVLRSYPQASTTASVTSSVLT